MPNAGDVVPGALLLHGYSSSKERLADTFAEQTGISLEVEARLDGRLPSEIETALYRIVQEALTNVVKHAGARNVSIVLTRKNGAVAALIEDDGRGFRPGAEDEGGLGLVGMNERVSLLGGRLTVESTAGTGTTVVAEVPLP